MIMIKMIKLNCDDDGEVSKQHHDDDDDDDDVDGDLKTTKANFTILLDLLLGLHLQKKLRAYKK